MYGSCPSQRASAHASHTTAPQKQPSGTRLPRTTVLPCRAQRDYLSQKLADLEGQLRDVSSERKEGERERRMVQAVAELRRRLPGLCRSAHGARARQQRRDRSVSRDSSVRPGSLRPCGSVPPADNIVGLQLACVQACGACQASSGDRRSSCCTLELQETLPRPL